MRSVSIIIIWMITLTEYVLYITIQFFQKMTSWICVYVGDLQESLLKCLRNVVWHITYLTNFEIATNAIWWSFVGFSVEADSINAWMQNVVQVWRFAVISNTEMESMENRWFWE